MQRLDEKGLKDRERGGKTNGRAYLANEDVIAAALANRMKVLVLPTPVLQRGGLSTTSTAVRKRKKQGKKALFVQHRRLHQCRVG